jgi:MFS family permease
VWLVALEGTVVATAMPRVIRDLGGAALYSLPFTFYMLAMTISGPLWGRFSDLWGRRKPYFGTLVLFLLGSALSGAAWNMEALVGARTLQGAGAGGLQALNLTLIGELYPMRERARVQSYISLIWGLSSVLGPLIGGVITETLSWRAVFLLAIPVGLLALTLVGRFYPPWRGTEEAPRIDGLGALWFSLSGVLGLYGLESQHWGLVGLAALLLAVFPRIEARHPMPLLPLQLLRDGFLRRSLGSNFLGGMAFFGSVAFIPLWGQTALGSSAVEAGLLLTPLSGGWTLSGLLAARWLPKWGPQRLIRLGAALITTGFTAWAMLSQSPLYVQMGCGLLVGLGMGQAMIALLISTQESVKRTELGVVTALIFFCRNVGGALGTALMSALLGRNLFEPAGLLARFPGVLLFAAALGLGMLFIGGTLRERPLSAEGAPDRVQTPQQAIGS